MCLLCFLSKPSSKIRILQPVICKNFWPITFDTKWPPAATFRSASWLESVKRYKTKDIALLRSSCTAPVGSSKKYFPWNYTREHHLLDLNGPIMAKGPNWIFNLAFYWYFQQEFVCLLKWFFFKQLHNFLEPWTC